MTDGAELPSRHAEIVCVCRGIARGAVAAAAVELAGDTPLTLTRLAQASGVLRGPCGGALCLVGVAALAAEASGRTIGGVELDVPGSWLLRAAGGEVDEEDRGTDEQAALPDAVEVVVVGAGLAGIGAALAVLDAGLRPLVLEHRAAVGGALRAEEPGVLTDDERTALARFRAARLTEALTLRTATTATRLRRDGERWHVDAASAHGATTVEARAVILASGGFVEPHPAVRAGILTADVAHDALDRGLVPGRRALVMGTGRMAKATVTRLRAVGLHVSSSHVPDARGQADLQGSERVERVTIGDDVHDVDALVLADRHVALRTLVPDDPDLVLSQPEVLPGLWLAGTCARPDVDHEWSLGSGSSVGASAAAAVWERT